MNICNSLSLQWGVGSIPLGAGSCFRRRKLGSKTWPDIVQKLPGKEGWWAGTGWTWWLKLKKFRVDTEKRRVLGVTCLCVGEGVLLLSLYAKLWRKEEKQIRMNQRKWARSRRDRYEKVLESKVRTGAHLTGREIYGMVPEYLQ